MPDSLLITPDTRRRLQQQYEQALRLAGQEPRQFARVHQLLGECLRTDPGETLYLDALLANLRQWQPKPRRSWLPSWLGGAKGWEVFRGTDRGKMENRPSAKDSRPPHVVLRDAPELLLSEAGNPAVLRRLAEAAGDCDLDEAEVRYLYEARNLVADDSETLWQLARALTRQGRFEEAAGPWFAVLALDPDPEAAQAVEDLQKAAECAPSPTALGTTNDAKAMDVASSLALARSLRAQGLLQAADHYLARAQFAAGGDLRVFEEREELRLAHSRQRLEIARARAASDPHPKAQSLVGRMEQEHNRLEIDIFHVRSERHPDDLSLRLELARRLKTAGNYSGAIQRLEEARADTRLGAAVLLELGECWQQLRQFDKALDYFRQAVESGPAVPVGLEWQVDENSQNMSDGDRQTTLVAALYRIGVLAAALDRPAEAKAALARLLSIDPDYKDARQRLDKLP